MPTIYQEYLMGRKREEQERKEKCIKDKEEHINNFILNCCVITSNDRDRIQSSLLCSKINDKINKDFLPLNSIYPKCIKKVVLTIEGISQKKSNGYTMYCGLKLLE